MDDEGRRCYEDFKILLTEERKKVARLEGWLLLLYPAGHHSLDVSDEEEQEIFDYIRELEGK